MSARKVRLLAGWGIVATLLGVTFVLWFAGHPEWSAASLLLWLVGAGIVIERSLSWLETATDSPLVWLFRPAALPVEWFAAGTLPPRCVRHGVSATHVDRRRFYRDVAAPFGLLLFVTTRLRVDKFFRKHVDGLLPACERCTRTRKRSRSALVVAWSVNLIAVVAVEATQSPNAALVWVVLFLASVLMTAARDLFRVRGAISSDGYILRLRGVAARFEAELHAASDPAGAGAAWLMPGLLPGGSELVDEDSSK